MLRISDLKSRNKRSVYYMFCNTLESVTASNCIAGEVSCGHSWELRLIPVYCKVVFAFNVELFICLFSWRYNPLRLYFQQPGSGL